MQTFKLSPSSLNLMHECPRCFWLHQHKAWRRPSGIFPSLPSGMDRILKIHFDKFAKAGVVPIELDEHIEWSKIKLFDDFDKLNKWRNNFKGIAYEDKNGNILHGAVDNLMIENNKLIVLDYKTRGYPLKKNTHEHYQLQMDIYNFLLRKNGYKTAEYALLLFYVPSEVTNTGEVIFDTTLVKMNIDVKKAETIWKKAIKLLNSDCPKDSCEWCEGR